MTEIDWAIIAVFFVSLVLVATITNRMNRSVAGFLSSERLAGRYLLTVAQAMAFFAAIGIIGQFESIYRNGLTGLWWGLIFIPIHTIISLTGFVIYRYRETRALTMAQFLEMRYGKSLRVFAGFLGFFAGILNCGVFPLVTTTFLVYFLQLPGSFSILGLALPTFHSVMFFMVAFAVMMAVAGGQITIMVTDFIQGAISSIAILLGIVYILYVFGWTGMIDTLMAAEILRSPTESEILHSVIRPEGASMINPFKLEGVLDFGIPFFLMMGFLQVLRTGVWQGGSGYMAAAKSPHEAKMGNILGGWRWLLQIVGTTIFALAAYVLLWSPEFLQSRAEVVDVIGSIEDSYLQGQLLVPLTLFELFPPGMIGLFAILMIGASISTDNSAYHSWGSIFLQDAIMPLRKKPFEKKEHLFWLRVSIVMIGVFAFTFSSFWTLRDYIFMWFQITNSIYVGGASCAIIGGLYWKKATAKGAWAGFLTGSILSVTGIILRQIYPGMTFPWSDQVIDGLYMAVFTIIIAYVVFIVVSLATHYKDFDMDRLLHRGAYAIAKDHPHLEIGSRRYRWLKRLGITREFSPVDKIIYFAAMGWTIVMVVTFIGWTVINVFNPMPSETWRVAWSYFVPVMLLIVFTTGIWFFIGGLRDVVRLFRGLAAVNPDANDDGSVNDDPSKPEKQ
jgi:SSS family solute:Na+ symporter